MVGKGTFVYRSRDDKNAKRVMSSAARKWGQLPEPSPSPFL
jgi:hypothetical protein